MLITELATQLQLSTRAIRYYEEVGLITPQKDGQNQYRLFTEHDAWRLQMIVALRELGLPIKQIRSLLLSLDQSEGSKEDTIRQYLDTQRSILFQTFIQLKEQIEVIDHITATEKEFSLDELHQLSLTSRHARKQREGWVDRWNFDRLAPRYDEIVSYPYRQEEREQDKYPIHACYEEALERVVHHLALQTGESGLEIGIGTGNLSARLLDRGVHLYGIDQSQAMLSICRKKFPQIETKLGNFLAIPYLDQRFTFIASSYALHHLTEEQKILALEEMDRLLQAGGRICIADLMFADNDHRQRYLTQLQMEGRDHWVREIEDEHYANRSSLEQWLRHHHYEVKTEQLLDYLHLIYAIKK
ncbi:MerR family transcriptional regulator [Mechercharimyces sp. CAU 1602]|uniref:MerR family transcriptional regulator n=1 Tax=Mechercharimyces sp. CAU 1602 TaxID=2973933 RepID=UPI002161FBD0|nr:MerR family transcriptional regulator [Mechercharimyces sp. CAU 1602]MCS1351970.1 MerR family transcriptional regulator [Mechercharimyces sp. CAU 1602]